MHLSGRAHTCLAWALPDTWEQRLQRASILLPPLAFKWLLSLDAFATWQWFWSGAWKRTDLPCPGYFLYLALQSEASDCWLCPGSSVHIGERHALTEANPSFSCTAKAAGGLSARPAPKVPPKGIGTRYRAPAVVESRRRHKYEPKRSIWVSVALPAHQQPSTLMQSGQLCTPTLH